MGHPKSDMMPENMENAPSGWFGIQEEEVIDVDAPTLKRGKQRREAKWGTTKSLQEITLENRGSFKIATYNLGTMVGKHAMVIDWAEANGIDVLAIQEHRLKKWPRWQVKDYAKKHGYKVCYGEEDFDSRGVEVRGVMILWRIEGYKVRDHRIPDAKDWWR